MDTVITTPLTTSSVLVVANTRHGPGGHYNHRAKIGDPPHDHLVDADEARDFLVRHNVSVPDGAPDAESLARLRTVQAAVHSLAAGNEAAAHRSAGLLAEEARYRLDAEGRLRADRAGWPGFADELLPPLLSLLAGVHPPRTCANPLCGWIFVDESRNRSRIWCDSTRCGNQQRVRRARQTHAHTNAV